MAKGTREAGNLAATGQTEDVIGKKVDIMLFGTWTGTVKLQRYIGSTLTWTDTGDSWTVNAQDVAEAATDGRWRLDFTKTTGSLDYDIRSE